MKLHLYQEISLLALKDEKGTFTIENLGLVLAGSIMAELLFEKRIAVSDDKKKFVELLDSSPTGDALLDECIQKIDSAKRPTRLAKWVNRIASIKRIHHRAAESLCDLGILRRTSDSVLLVFNRTVYPEVNHAPEQALLDRLERLIFSPDQEPTPRDILLVSLADASELLLRIYGRKRLNPQKERIKQIVSGEVAGKATKDLIQEIQIATIVAVTTAVTVVVTN
ncbi:GOLPH3/VPS74 family protein [Pelagicoccus albus]|uniref:GPP34 family phosphoprotein n=1 Tax=Pelagicoccus albus TaxID=415222 RepID=A0A7X1B9V0_9BACT|nr:GPP34 family phosphoprotein [Pelagicoccus albus]MBC2608004.1 GPP34 family phosphoprotein [Pelagicoccus albus]